MTTPTPTVIEYRLGKLEEAVGKLADTVDGMRTDLSQLATKGELEQAKAEVTAAQARLDDRVRALETSSAASRPWVAPATAGAGLTAAASFIWQMVQSLGHG